jgi:hypothetical protein
MTDKILVYLDYQFLHYAIAKYIQNNHDCELFGIVDLNPKPKKFFEEQKSVNFKKLWYFKNETNPDNHKVDMNYLKEFEKKYGINLWKIVYAERKFYPKYNMYYRFSEEEILIIIEQNCKFFENIINELKPDFLLINTTDWHHMELLVQLCKSRGIHVLMLDLAKFGNRVKIDNESDIKSKKDSNFIPTKNFKELRKYLEKGKRTKEEEEIQNNLFVSWKKIFSAFKEIIKTTNDKEYRKNYSNYGKSMFKVLISNLDLKLKTIYRNWFINKFQKIIKDELFVYFPLHFEPERVLLINSPYYTNQITVIENIAKSLPINYWLYVKEHPTMNILGWRDTNFYKKIQAIPNVKLIHPKVSSTELIKKCSLVISINGTTAIESLFYEKPSIVFSKIWGQSQLPSIVKIENIEDLPKIIEKSLKIKIKPEELENYLEWLNENSTEFRYINFMVDVWRIFYFGGVLVNVEISNKQINELTNKYKDQIESLAKWHIERMELRKKLKIKF